MKKLNILIDIGHPAHVHYYRNLAKELEYSGHNVYWTVKNIPIIIELLNYYGFSYTLLLKKVDTLFLKIIFQFKHNWLLINLCKRKKIDVAIGTSIAVAYLSKITKTKSIILDDDDDLIQPLVSKFVNPFASALLSPSALSGKRSRIDTIYYNGYQELMYLHPKRFTPELSVLEEVGLQPGDVFFIMRFNVFKAHHDIGVQGLNLEQKLILIELLKHRGKVFVTSERKVEPELEKYQLKIHPSKIHSLMFYSSIFLGDSQTMTSEASVLGIPSLRCNTFSGQISYLKEQEERYELTYAFHPNDFNKMVSKLKEMLSTENIKESWKIKQKVMLDDMIDVTAFMVWLIQNHHQSIQIMHSNPDYHLKFR